MIADEGDLFDARRGDARCAAGPAVHPAQEDDRRGVSRPSTVGQRRSCSPTCDQAKSQPLWRVLVALSIRHVGPTAARALASRLRLASTRSARPPRGAGRRRGRRAGDRRGGASSGSTSTGTPAIVDKWAAAGVRMADEVDESHAADPRGADRRRHRLAGGLQPRRGQGGDPRPRRQGLGLGVEEDRLRGGGRERRAPRPTRPAARRAGPRRGRLPAPARRTARPTEPWQRRPATGRRTVGWRAPRLGAMSALTRDEVAHLAVLARIDLTDAELDRLAGQLGVILDVGRRGSARSPPTTSRRRRTRCR